MDAHGILITGAGGQLGRALCSIYPGAQATDYPELDISDKKSLDSYNWSTVKTIINTGAYTNVDGAETPDGRVSAWKINAAGVANLVRLATEKDITLVHISTDYVFDGAKNPHTEDEPLSPLSVYGASKAAGDVVLSTHAKHYLIRTSFVIGEGHNFVRIMLDVGKKRINPSVIADQLGRITFATELAKAIDHLLRNGSPFGAYNVTNSGKPASWADLTREIFKLAGFSNTVSDTTTEEYYKDKPQSAPRPLNSVMDLTKIEAAGFAPRDWHEDLAEYVKKEVSK